MQLTKELVLQAFLKYIEATSNRFNVSTAKIYTEVLEEFHEPLVIIPICMFIYGYVRASEPTILDSAIDFEFIKRIVLERIKAKE